MAAGICRRDDRVVFGLAETADRPGRIIGGRVDECRNFTDIAGQITGIAPEHKQYERTFIGNYAA